MERWRCLLYWIFILHDIMSRPVYRDCVFHCLSMSKKGGVVMIFPEEELETGMDDREEYRRVWLTSFIQMPE